jgi:hypothetical protein
MKIYKNIHKITKPKLVEVVVEPDQNVACVKINKAIDFDRKYLEFVKKNKKRNKS